MALIKNTDLKFGKSIIVYYTIFYTITDIFEVLIAQYCNKQIINYLGIENLVLSFALFFVLLYCFFNNIHIIEKFIRMKFLDFKLHKITNNLKERAFNYTIQHSMSYFNNSFSGDISSKISNISKQFRTSINAISFIINNFIFFIISLIFFAKINIYIAISFLISVIIYLSLHKIFCLDEYAERHKITAEARSKYFGLINDIFTNIINVKSFSQSHLEKINSSKQILNIQSKEKNLMKSRVKMLFMSMFSLFLLFFCTISITAILLLYGKITSGDFVAVVILLHILQFYLKVFLRSIGDYYASKGIINNSIEKLYQPIEIIDKTEKELILTDGMIKFNNITFGYKNK